MKSIPAAPRLPSLDGWRALFIAIVVASHFAPHTTIPLPDGGFGVRCFFVLSGFIITYLMMQEAGRTGGVDVRAFWRRRVLRIFPAYFFFLAVVLVLQLSGAVHIDSGDWLNALTFTANFGVGMDDWTLFHLWSLAIEQQFYLLWPLAFVALRPWRGASASLWAFSALIGFVLAYRLVRGVVVFWLDPSQYPIVAALRTNLGFLFGGGATFNHLDTLAAGCIAAIMLFHHRAWLELRPRLVNGVAVGCLAVLAMSIYWMPEAGLGRAFGYELTPTVQAIATAALITASVAAPRWFGILNWKPIVALGIVSYSLYLWQQPFTAVLLPGAPSAVRILAALIVAVASYWLIERPFLRLRHRPVQAKIDAATLQSAP